MKVGGALGTTRIKLRQELMARLLPDLGSRPIPVLFQDADAIAAELDAMLGPLESGEGLPPR